METNEVTVSGAFVIPLVCSECGIVGGVGDAEVVVVGEVWSCWGRNCFDFNFSKHADISALCGECENDEYMYFECCGALVDRDCLYGAEEINDDDEFVGYRCPECETLVHP